MWTVACCHGPPLGAAATPAPSPTSLSAAAGIPLSSQAMPRRPRIVRRHLAVSIGAMTQRVAATLRAALSFPVTENWSPRCNDLLCFTSRNSCNAETPTDLLPMSTHTSLPPLNAQNGRGVSMCLMASWMRSTHSSSNSLRRVAVSLGFSTLPCSSNAIIPTALSFRMMRARSPNSPIASTKVALAVSSSLSTSLCFQPCKILPSFHSVSSSATSREFGPHWRR
mmetsp:Transcript_17575/g.52055  ORF Transcript_17575/g.52055 Transcript_17575/m.52055 type:complete len:224 (-) Transcript_17575:774-1445(-)